MPGANGPKADGTRGVEFFPRPHAEVRSPKGLSLEALSLEARRPLDHPSRPAVAGTSG